MADNFLSPSPILKTQNYDSDKENKTPVAYRSKIPVLNNTTDIEDKDISLMSDTSYMTSANSTTSQLNNILAKVNVHDKSRLRYVSDDISEISFDLKPGDMSINNANTANDSSKLTVTTQSFTTPLRVMSSTSSSYTPTWRKHPFNDSTIDHCPAFSPSVLQSKDNSDFKWSIDHISEMNPVDIQDDQPSYILEAEKKLHEDTEYQEKLRNYFANNCVAPSPMCSLLGSQEFTKESQTNISLPVDFDLESVLGQVYLMDGPTQHKTDASFRRMLFNDRSSSGRDEEELVNTDIEELQHSPVIPSVHCSPLSSDNSPSFIIGGGDELLNCSITLSPIESGKQSIFRTPGRPTSHHMSTPGLPTTQHMSTPGLPTSYHMSTPGPTAIFSTPAHSSEDTGTLSSNKRKYSHTPDKIALFRSSPFISPIPPRGAVGHIRRHPKCPKKPRVEADSPLRKVKFKLECKGEVESPMSSPASSVASPADSTAGNKMPMESSRIETGAEQSSEKLSPNPILAGIQPLDISEIKPPDLASLRTNNYLDISDKSPLESRPPDICPDENPDDCQNADNWTDDTKNKDSGLGTSSGMSTMISTANSNNFDTLPPLSEIPMDANILALDSRPGKRKYENSPRSHFSTSDDAGFYPPPVKRVVTVGPVNCGRRKHKSE